MKRPKWVSEWHVAVNAVLAVLLIMAYVAHFFESALGDLAKVILHGPSLTMLILLYVALISSRLEMTHDHFAERMRALEENRLLEMAERLDPVLRQVLGHYIDDAVANVSSAIQKRELTFHEPAVVPFLYRRLLESFKGRTFCSITTPNKSIWRSEDVYKCMHHFIRIDKGKILRVFVLDCEPTPEQKSIINRHVGIGVTVRLIRYESIDKLDMINFLVEGSGAFGWRVQPSLFEGRQKLVATSSQSETGQLLATFHRIWPHATELTAPLT